MRILLLSTTTGYQLRSFGEAAGELGIDLLFGTDRCRTLDDPWRDAAVPVRFHEESRSVNAVTAAARERPIDGLIAVGDRPVVLAAKIAVALGLPGNPPAAAAASAHKALARAAFAAASLPAPWHLRARVGDDLDAVLRQVRYPAVIKPAALSGSRGVIRADSPRELRDAFRRVSALLARPEMRALRTGAEHELVIEGFIPGREFAVEGLLTRGHFRPLALFDKPDPLDGPFFEETIYVAPARVEPDDERRIHETVAAAARALGLWHGPVHAECRVNGDGVFVLEVAARPIGGLCSRVLRFETPGRERLTLEHLLLRHATGEDVSSVRREPAAAAVMMIPIPRRGIFRGALGQDEARQVRFVEDVRITAKPDQLLEPLPEAGSYLGFVFARAPRAEQAEAALREAHGRLTFKVDPAIDLQVAAPE